MKKVVVSYVGFRVVMHARSRQEFGKKESAEGLPIYWQCNDK
jgi:hypothetical protein